MYCSGFMKLILINFGITLKKLELIEFEVFFLKNEPNYSQKHL